LGNVINAGRYKEALLEPLLRKLIVTRNNPAGSTEILTEGTEEEYCYQNTRQ